MDSRIHPFSVVATHRSSRESQSLDLSGAGFVHQRRKAVPFLTHDLHVAICDVHLSGASGLWLIDQIRTTSLHTAIILATADPSISALQSLRAGTVAYLVKPFRLDELKAAVEAGVRRRSDDPNRALVR
jgi:DNA-binding response OmpR family regulator